VPNIEILQQLIKDIGLEPAQKLINMFQKDVDERLDFIHEHLETGGDVKALRDQAHTLKGLCLSYGAKLGSEAAKDLQEACNDGDESLIQAKAHAALEIIPIDVKAVATFIATCSANA